MSPDSRKSGMPARPMSAESFSILMAHANEFMREIHDRMPVILDRSDEEAWLDPEFQHPEQASAVDEVLSKFLANGLSGIASR
jgi:putative SOS response-associated peptidase YedK